MQKSQWSGQIPFITKRPEGAGNWLWDKHLRPASGVTNSLWYHKAARMKCPDFLESQKVESWETTPPPNFPLTMGKSALLASPISSYFWFGWVARVQS